MRKDGENQLTILKNHFTQMANETDGDYRSIISDLSNAIDGYLKNKSPETKGKILRILNVMTEAIEYNDARRLRAYHESWSMDLD